MADRRIALRFAANAGLSALLASCATVAPVEGPVRLGQVAAVGGPRVRPERVIEDSRCPIDADCVWAGRLIVRAVVLGGGWSRQIDLTLGRPVQVADGSLTLVEAVPARTTGGRGGRPLPYRFTFAFQGGR